MQMLHSSFLVRHLLDMIMDKKAMLHHELQILSVLLREGGLPRRTSFHNPSLYNYILAADPLAAPYYFFHPSRNPPAMMTRPRQQVHHWNCRLCSQQNCRRSNCGKKQRQIRILMHSGTAATVTVTATLMALKNSWIQS